MINGIRDFNIMNNKVNDMKMIPLRFSTFQLLLDRLITNHPGPIPKEGFTYHI